MVLNLAKVLKFCQFRKSQIQNFSLGLKYVCIMVEIMWGYMFTLKIFGKKIILFWGYLCRFVEIISHPVYYYDFNFSLIKKSETQTGKQIKIRTVWAAVSYIQWNFW